VDPDPGGPKKYRYCKFGIVTAIQESDVSVDC